MKAKLLVSLAFWILSITLSTAALSVTFTNPAPADYDNFGFALAAMGSDRVLIGAYRDDVGADDAGAAFLFSTNGALLATFLNPTPAPGDFFGFAVAAVGVDKVLVGAYGKDIGAADAGAAFLFSTNGALLTTFTNPTPAASDIFGISVAALGSDRVIISAYSDDAGATDAGVVHLFRTNGTLLTTIADPTPSFSEYFGYAVAAMGTDKVLVGAVNSSTACLFNTNGMLLITFTNPAPAASDYFGGAVAAIGVDKVLVGASRKHIGNTDAGAAYLFGTNGALLTTFTNPTPAASDWFGSAVAGVGSGKVLIGAPLDNTGGSDAGSAYLFNLNGTLLTTINNPTPASSDFFGFAVAAMGGTMPLVGAHGDNTGATDAGAAYLFAAYLEPPSVTTLPASMKPDDSVTFNGTANPNGQTTLAWFESGTTTNYGNQTVSTNVGNGASPVPVMLPVTGLLTGTVYHCRIVASNLSGVETGSDRTFPFPPPIVLTEPPTALTANGATLHGTVYPNDWPATVWFRWRDTDGSGADEMNGAQLRISPRTNGVPLSLPITGLIPGHHYACDLWVTNGSFYTYDTRVFTTPLPATAITLSGSGLTSSNGTLAGSVNPMSLPSRTWFEWGTTTNYGNVTGSLDVGAGNAIVPVSVDINQLSGLSDYHFRLVVSNAAGVVYGGDNEMSTLPGRDVGDWFYVTPTLIQANAPKGTRVTATACGRWEFPTTSDWRVRLTRNGVPLQTNMAILSVTPTKAVLNFPSMNAGFYGFLIQYSNGFAHVWEDVYESGPRFFQVGADTTAHTYTPFPRGNWTTPTQPRNFIGTDSRIITGTITGAVTFPQQILPRTITWSNMFDPQAYVNSGRLHLGWTRDFPLDDEGEAGVQLTFSFPLDGAVTFNYAIPFQMILDIPTNVYAGQNIRLKARDFRFQGGTLSAQHNLSFSTDHGLWVNAPYDLAFPPLDNEHSFKSDRLVVWGELPVAPKASIFYGPIDSTEFPWSELPYAFLFDDGDVTISEIAAEMSLPDLPDYLESRISYANATLGGQTAYGSSGASASSSYGPHTVWTAGPQDGWQEAPELWYANVDMIGLAYVSSIPYYSQAAAPLFWAGVELGLNCGVNLRSRDVIILKPPYSHDLAVQIPASANGPYTVVTNLSLPIDATLVSYYLYNLWGGVYFDMPFISRKDLAWEGDGFWRPEVSTNISVAAAFSINTTVSVSDKAAWNSSFLLPAFPPDLDYDLISYPPEEAAEERRTIANISFSGPPPPMMIPSLIMGTLPDNPASQMEIMLSANPVAGGTIALTPSPVNGGYSNGTVATLTAITNRFYRFTGWSGDIAGTNNPMTIAMNTNKIVIANFTTLTLANTGYSTNGSFRFNVGGMDGQKGVVQWSTNLGATNWITLMTNTSPFNFTDTNAGRFQQGFYRVLLVP